MTTEKILEVVLLYRTELERRKIPQQRMPLDRTIGSLTSEERLAHAHFLLDGVAYFAQLPGKEGKTGRHLASVQMILSFENWYSLTDIMSHNRPDSRK